MGSTSLSGESCGDSVQLRTPRALTVIVLLIGLGAVAILIVFFIVGRPSNHFVTLSWQTPMPVPGVAVVSYNIYRSVSHGGPYAQIAAGVTRLTYSDSIVNSGTTYYYVVTAVADNGHESTYSTEARARIP
jgi:hypothetical protein